jgi:hypothetical protein
MTKPIPDLETYYRTLRVPNELERHLAAQKKPGGAPDWAKAWASQMMPDTDPRKVAWKRASINGEEIDLDDLLRR